MDKRKSIINYNASVQNNNTCEMILSYQKGKRKKTDIEKKEETKKKMYNTDVFPVEEKRCVQKKGVLMWLQEKRGVAEHSLTKKNGTIR